MNVLVTDPVHEDGLNILEEFSEVEVATDLDQKELIEKIPGFDVMIVRSGTKVTGEILDAARDLKLIVRAGVGLDNIDLDHAGELGIQVENTPETSTTAVSELTLALMLAWARNIPKADRSLKRGEWLKPQLGGTELEGKTLGIVGTGRIGWEVAKRAKTFGVNLLAYDITEREEFEDLGGRYVTLENLLMKSDYLTLHVPLNESTRHIIDTQEFELMKDSAVLVNASRGEIVEEEALVNALEEGEIAGACLDVYESDPTENDRLLKLDNVVLTPHLGASTEEAQRRVSVLAAEKVRDILA